MSRLLQLALLFTGVLSLAAAPKAVANVTASIGANVAYEYASEGRSAETRTPLSLRGGWRTGPHNFQLEYSQFKTSSGVEILSIERRHHEWTGWYRHELGRWRLRPYVAGGLGIHYEVIETGFNGDSSRDVGNPVAHAAAAAGARFAFTRNLEILAEAKLAVSPSYAPNPMVGLGAHLGFVF